MPDDGSTFIFHLVVKGASLCGVFLNDFLRFSSRTGLLLIPSTTVCLVTRWLGKLLTWRKAEVGPVKMVHVLHRKAVGVRSGVAGRHPAGIGGGPRGGWRGVQQLCSLCLVDEAVCWSWRIVGRARTLRLDPPWPVPPVLLVCPFHPTFFTSPCFPLRLHGGESEWAETRWSAHINKLTTRPAADGLVAGPGPMRETRVGGVVRARRRAEGWEGGAAL